MKKKNRLSLTSFFVLFVCVTLNTFKAQSSFNGHLGTTTATDWCGWNAASTIPFSLEHRGNQQITFSTNGAMRMFIDNGTNLNTGGRIAIGNNLPVGFAPTARVHIHQNGATGFPQNNTPQMRFTTNVTNVTATDGFVIGNQTFNPLLNQPSIGYLINYEPSAPVAFYTDNTAVAGGTPAERMRVNAFNFNGFVGVGNTTAFSAAAQMHVNVLGLNTGGLGFAGYSKLLRTDGDSTHNNQWELYTGTTNANLVPKYRLSTSGPNANNNQGADVYQEAVQGDMIFKVNGKRLGSPASGNMPPNATIATNASREAMRVSKVFDIYLQKNEGRVSISMDTTVNGHMVRNPRAMLHIGEVSSGGWRPWMNVGTFYDYGTDCMYTGVRSLNPTNFDDNEAVVAWGNNPNSGSGFNNDRLRFIFTAAGIVQNGTAGLVDGLETMRIIADTGTSKVGIGNFFNPATNPANMLEIKSDAKCPYWLTNNSSGLRFRNLKSSSAIVANGVNGVNNQKLLTVDQNGDVVLTNSPAGGSSLGNICGATQNPLISPWEIPMANNNYIFSRTAAQTGNVGIGVMQTLCAPGNLLEVRKGATGSISGLRLTDLAGATPLATNGNVLSVNSSGDVILVPDVSGGPGGGITNAQNGLSLLNPTTVELGGPLGSASAAQLFGNREIPMTAQKIFFSGFQNDGLVIGPNSLAGLPLAKLHVVSTDGASRQGIYVENNNPGSTNIGITSKAINSTGNSAYGVVGTGGDGRYNVGVLGSAAYTPWSYISNGPGYSYGVHGQAIATDDMAHIGIRGETDNSSIQNVGGYFTALNSTANSLYNYGISAYANGGTVQNRAVYASTSGNSANGTVDNWAGYFDGDVNINAGGYFLNGTAFSSDAMFKTHIDTIIDPTNIIKHLMPKSYFFDTTNTYGMNFSSKKQYGFIAQDVQTVLPELVSTVHKAARIDALGNTLNPAVNYKSLNYNAFFALTIAAMQKQQQTIDSLKKKDSLQTSQIAHILNAINTLSNSIAACCSNSNARTTGITGNNPNQLSVELSDKNAIVLNQNVPNPFAESTVITYNIPVDFKVAQIIFNAMDGRIIKAVDINQKGKGELNVYANDLTNGLYSYYLIVDGKVIDTKKLVKQN